MAITEAGSVNDVRPVQPPKAVYSMDLRPSASVNDESPVQLANASPLITNTEEGIVTDSIVGQLLNTL
ncbi:hypothetical protein SDC9_192202 [bioreactor metagenome]|uniref:Uncharacterized protein n=1 Tax=bioreactor metagenome TaxID=1076179 RepID=A0A645I047_9ZZZZ